MTKLIITPIDAKAKGSWKERKRYRQITARLTIAQNSTDIAEQIAALDAAEDWVISRLHTDDGTPLETALDQLSAEDFDSLLRGAAPEETMGEANAVASGTPLEATAK